MKHNSIKTIDLIVLTVVILSVISFAYFFSSESDNLDYRRQYLSDSLSFRVDDEMAIEQIKDNNNTALDSLFKTISEFKDIDQVKIAMDSLLNVRADKSKSLITTRTNHMLQNHRVALKARSNTPRHKVIISLILLAGLIGGYARTRGKYLIAFDKIVSTYQTIIQRLNLKTINDQPVSQEDINIQKERIETLNKDLTTLREEINTELPIVVLTNIFFGIIGSSLAFIALKLFDSDTLSFVHWEDYYLLWGWCVLGALFVRKMLGSLYGKWEK